MKYLGAHRAVVRSGSVAVSTMRPYTINEEPIIGGVSLSMIDIVTGVSPSCPWQ